MPTNLYARVPDGVEPRHAAFGTVGAIALQGVRRGEPQLGEVALVIGLGLIGQLVAQLLTRPASGSSASTRRPAAVRARRAARRAGLRRSRRCRGRSRGRASSPVGTAWTRCTWPPAATATSPVELAARLARDRGRVVDIGKCRLDLPWNAYYEKELDLRFSRSYGPGRYDPATSSRAATTPIGYVRWTERRNLAVFPRPDRPRTLDVEPLVSQVADYRVRRADLRAAELRGAERRRRPVPIPGPARQPSEHRRPRRPTRRVRSTQRPSGSRQRRSRYPVGRSAEPKAGCGSRSSAPATTRPRCCCRISSITRDVRAGTGGHHLVAVGARTHSASSASTGPAPTSTRCSPIRRSTRSSSSPGTARTPS